jgi:hypothetical protein
MKHFKILTQAVDLFKKINEGKDEGEMRLHEVELTNEKITGTWENHSFTIFEYDGEYRNQVALEHARLCAYETIIVKGKKQK